MKHLRVGIYMENVVTLIGSLGFPIFMCLLMYKQNDTQDSRHMSEIEELRKTVDNNTKVVQKLLDRIGD